MYSISCDFPGRLRIRYGKWVFDSEQAVALKWMIAAWPMIINVETNEVNGSILFEYTGSRKELMDRIDLLDIRHIDITPYDKEIREYNEFGLVQKKNAIEHTDQFVWKVVKHYFSKWFLPSPIKNAIAMYHAIHYIRNGLSSLLHGRLDVPVLDGASITVSMLNGDFSTAREIMFLLSVSDLLEDYTKKNTTLRLKESLAVSQEQIWIEDGDHEIEVPMDILKKGDTVIIQMGSMIPVDGEIVKGEGMINESAFTGEPLSKAVGVGNSVFAGSVVEEGKLYIQVRNLQQESRINRIVDMIDQNESLKSEAENKAIYMANALVPYSFLLFFGLLAGTRNLTRASSVLMVDYSCAIKLSTSISVISAMQEASQRSIMVKGGKYLEAMANADTIVFDKTGTLTNATPLVQNVIPMDGYDREEVLKIAACLEEHFPHSIANAIVKQAADEGIIHSEEHAKVNYIVAHGISTILHDQKAIIGSDHFVFEDEETPKTEEIKQKIEELQSQGACSLIYLAIGGTLAGIISIYDPLKEESKQVVQELREEGFTNIIMLTGDSMNAARFVANELQIDDYRYGILPEDKAEYIHQLKEQGHTVVMVGDGVNDTPALSSSDVSVSMQNSSDIARELADITLVSSSLNELVDLRRISKALLNKIDVNYHQIVAFNSILILLGAAGIFSPSLNALLHNGSTFLFALKSMQPVLKTTNSN